MDRVFSLRGIGTVVTGTLIGGSLSRGQTVVVQPTGRVTRIRSMQSYHAQVQTSVPLALPLLGYLNTAVAYGASVTGNTAPAAISTTYTLVVADQARHNAAGD